MAAALDPKEENAKEDEDEPMTDVKESEPKNDDAAQTQDAGRTDGCQLSLPPAPEITEENFREVVLKACQHLLTQFGGPVQYLKQQLGDRPSQLWAGFAEELSLAFPRREDRAYLDGLELPRLADETHSFCVSLWQLGWLPCCSSKPATFKLVATQLIDEYVTNTVLTAGDPLLLYQQPKEYTDDYECPPCFWTHYMKGAARATSMLMLAHVLLRVLKVDVAILNCNLHQSLTTIHCRLGTAASDATTIALENARFSSRGSIRKAHDVITWAGKLHTLKNKGLQPSEIIKAFNSSATSAAVLEGAKRVGVMNLLDLPMQCLDLLLKHLSDFGSDDCAFKESVWGNKKLMPGFQPRANNDRAWQKRLQVTADGFELFIRYVDSCHARKQPGSRSKYDTAALTEALQMSQLLVSCFNEVSDQHALQQKTKDEQIINPFLDGNNKLELELQGAISELKKGWQPAEITIFKDLIATCIAKRDGTMESLGKGPKINAGQLEKQAFDLLLSSMQHDADVYAVWKAKCNDRDSALYYQRLNHAAMRHSRAREMAESVITDDRGLGWFMSISKLESKDSPNITTWKEVCAHIVKQCQLRSEDQVRSVCILNWSAPSLFAGAVQNRQATLMGTIVNSGATKSFGIGLAPSFFYKKGSLHKLVENANKLLANANVNIDTPFALAFSNRNDERQKRPLLQTGFLALPGESKATDSTWQHWKGTDVFKFHLVKDAALPLSADLVEMEDLSEEALPSSTDDKTHPCQAEKHQQIGQDAASKILASALTNAPAEAERAAILIVDPSARTLEFAKAAYELKKTIGLPVYYLGFAETDGQAEWQRVHMSMWLADGFLNGSLPVPAGHQPLAAAELPSELVTAMPPKPDLGTLTWSNKKHEDGLPTLKTPDKILQAWHDHQEFGEPFRDWLKKTRGLIPLDIPDDKDPKKRTSSASAASASSLDTRNEQPAAKKVKKETPSAALTSIAVADLPTPLSFSAQLPLPQATKKAGGKCRLVIAIGSKLFLANDGTAGVELSAGTTVAGYWKGSWLKREGEPRVTDVPYELRDANDTVILDNKVTSLGQVIKEKRAISPLEIKVLYHTLVDKPTSEDSSFFKCEEKQNQQVLFRTENVPIKEEQKDNDCVTLPHGNLAGCLPAATWDTLATHVVWVLRWTARGLSPVRPLICLKDKCIIKQGQAVALQASNNQE